MSYHFTGMRNCRAARCEFLLSLSLTSWDFFSMSSDLGHVVVSLGRHATLLLSRGETAAPGRSL